MKQTKILLHSIATGPSIRVDGVRFRKVRITGDGNCLFRAVGHCLNHYTEHDHKILRKMAHDWCLENQSDITLSDSQISEIGKDGVFGSDVSLRALADRLKITIKVVYELSKTLGQDEQTYNPTTGRPKEVVYLYFSIRGSHYDALQREEGQPDAIYSGWLQSSQVIQEVDTALAKDQHKTKTRKRQNETEAENKSPKRRKIARKFQPVAFQSLPKKERQNKMLLWIGFEQSEVNEVGEIKEFFNEDAWLGLKNVLEIKEKNSLWSCKECRKTIENDQNTVACEACLEWFHFTCLGIKRKPRVKTWFCTICKQG